MVNGLTYAEVIMRSDPNIACIGCRSITIPY